MQLIQSSRSRSLRVVNRLISSIFLPLNDRYQYPLHTADLRDNGSRHFCRTEHILGWHHLHISARPRRSLYASVDREKHHRFGSMIIAVGKWKRRLVQHGRYIRLVREAGGEGKPG